MNNETSYFLFQIISFKKYFYVSVGSNCFTVFWSPPSCGGPGQLPSLPCLKSGPGNDANFEQVCVQPPPSTVNMTLPAFAVERRRLPSVDISCPRGAQQQTCRTPLLLSIDGTDGRTAAAWRSG